MIYRREINGKELPTARREINRFESVERITDNPFPNFGNAKKPKKTPKIAKFCSQFEAPKKARQITKFW